VIDNIPELPQLSMQSLQMAIKRDTEAQIVASQQATAAAVTRNAETQRLLAMATAQAEAQMRRSAQSSDFMGNLGYVCKYCRQNPARCSCSSTDVMGSI